MSNRARLIIRSWDYTQDDIGGLIPGESSSWEIWADVENRAGKNITQNAQNTWTYDYKIKVRYESTRVIGSGNTINYDDKVLAIRSVQFDKERDRRYVNLYCEAIDVNTATGGGGSVAAVPLVKFYSFTAPSDGSTFTIPLSGKNIIGAYRDGIFFIPIYSGTSTEKHVLISGTTYTWSVEMRNGEKATIAYI